MENVTQPELHTSDANPASAETDLTGQTLDDFQVLRRLGQGGMGQVYLAEQVSLRRHVALKILRPDLASDPGYLQRFQSEALAVAKATHANIVQVYTIGEHRGLRYMALEYVEGRNLRDFLAKKGSPELLLALSIMRQVAAGLQRASELGIVHRDIKPENILLTRKGEVKVTDFGLARSVSKDQPLSLTQTGVTLGTPLYMSPEQVQGQPLDPRSDIYSFGVTCYHMLSGQPPFRGETAFQVALQHVQTEAPSLAVVRPDLPAELCAMVYKMMAKKPEDRYQTPRELLREISRLRDSLVGTTGALTTQQVSAGMTAIRQPDSPAPTTAGAASGARRRRFWMTAGVGLTVALATGMISAAFCYHLATTALPPPSEFAEPSLEATDLVVEGFSPQKREQFLKKVVDQYAHPGDDRSKINLGLGHCIELALFYLEQRRLAEADEFFTKLEKLEPPVRFYRHLAGLGHAAVLAFRDQPILSNQQFQRLLVLAPQRERAEVQAILRLHPNLREMIGQSLEHNRHNLPLGTLPPGLESFRKPPSSRSGSTTPP
jgi:serine/threonine-protein kinase